MPLHFATEPKNGTALVQKALSKLATRSSPLSARAIDFNALQVQQPHAVYDLRADAIAHGDGLASAKASGFRYLVATGGTTVAAAEVLADANGNATVLANVNYGPYVEATARALAQVATLSAVGAGSYEVRLLRFSAIALMALWLKPDSGGPISSIRSLPLRMVFRPNEPIRSTSSCRPSFRSRRSGSVRVVSSPELRQPKGDDNAKPPCHAAVVARPPLPSRLSR